MKCGKHPTYQAKRKPTAKCEVCRMIRAERERREGLIELAIESGLAMLEEGGSVRIGFTDDELKVMAQVIYDDLNDEKLWRE